MISVLSQTKLERQRKTSERNLNLKQNQKVVTHMKYEISGGGGG